MASQITDTSITRAEIETHAISSGLWATPELRQRNGYVLSPCVYVVSKDQQAALQRLAQTVYLSLGSLENALGAIAPLGQRSLPQAEFFRLATRARRGLFSPGVESGLPPIVKVDLVQDGEGRYFVAEVDAYNPRGLGYISFLEESLPSSLRWQRFPGVSMVRDLLLQQSSTWTLIVSEFERYYEAAFQVFCQVMQKHGVDISLVCEQDLSLGDLSRIETRHVLLLPESFNRRPQVRDALLDLYRHGEIKLWYPPKAYLGSKAFLPFLAEHGMEEFIPKTMLVGQKMNGAISAFVERNKPVVLKGCMSSGMKQVVFSDLHAERFAGALELASQAKNPQWILQDQVPQASIPVIIFDDEGNRVTRDYYFRVIAHVTKDGVLDVEVTGRPDRLVHGAPDCIQLPSILE